jgi:formylglycine-generating enzyme required for sulfatase activity
LDTAAHIFYGGINTLTAGGAYIVFNEKLGLGIKYFTPPPQNLREQAQVFSGGLLVAAPLKGVVLKGMGIKAPPTIQVPNTNSAAKVSAKAANNKATTTVETPPSEPPPFMGHPMEASPYRRGAQPNSPYRFIEVGPHKLMEIPAGPRVVGEPGNPSNPPRWIVLRDAIGVDETSLTEGKFEATMGRKGNSRAPSDHPMTEVSQTEAEAYAKKHGLRLLTEWEWEISARGLWKQIKKRAGVTAEKFAELISEGYDIFVIKIKVGEKIYTDAAHPDLHRVLDEGGTIYALRRNGTRSGRLNHREAWYDQYDQYQRTGYGTTSADWGPANSYGLKGMCGNVWDWTSSNHKPIKPWPLIVQRLFPWLEREGPDFYRPRTVDPQGPQAGNTKVLRGGSWIINRPDSLRAAYRHGFHPGLRLGFRVGRRLLRQHSNKK